MRKLIISLLTAAVLAYLGLCAYYYVFQERLIYLPDKVLSTSPKDLGLTYKDLTLTTSDGVTINAWYVPSSKARATVLFSHGNAGNIGNRLETIRMIHSLGLNVLVYDYRGFGRSEGSAGEDGTYRDAEAAWDHLTEHAEIAPELIILWGRSLGGAVAIELATRKKAGALIVESTFTSLSAMAEIAVPYLPGNLLVRHRYANSEKVPAITIPALFIHSPDDEMIPFAHGRELYEKISSQQKTFVAINGSHNTGYLVSGDLYKEAVREFLAKHFGPH